MKALLVLAPFFKIIIIIVFITTGIHNFFPYSFLILSHVLLLFYKQEIGNQTDNE